MKELVSMIIPIYNVGKYLEKSIDSAINQTYSNIEILLVDDGSTDDSGKICDKYSEIEKRIQAIHKVNGGLPSARNAAIEIARGDFVCFVDNDDCVEPEYVEKLLKYATDNNCDIVCCGHFVSDEDENKNVDALKKLAKYELTDFAWDKLYRKSLWKNIRYPFGMLCEDMGTTFKVFAEADKVGTIDDVLYNYLQRSNSIVHSKNVKRSEDTFMMYKSRYEFFLNYFKEKDLKSEKELVKLAYYACSSSKKDRRENIYRTAKNVLMMHHITPYLGSKGRIKLVLYKIIWYMQFFFVAGNELSEVI